MFEDSEIDFDDTGTRADQSGITHLSTKRELYDYCLRHYHMPDFKAIDYGDLERIVSGERNFFLPSKSVVISTKRRSNSFLRNQLHEITNFLLLSKYGKILPFKKPVAT